MSSHFYALPEYGFAVSILSNGYNDDFSNTAVLAMQLINTLPAPVPVTSFLGEPSDIEGYAGSYLDTNGVGRMELTYDGADLLVSMPDLEEAGHTVGTTLDALYNDYFLLKIDGIDYSLEFADGSDGAAHQYGYNRSFCVTRTADAEAMERAVPVRWAPVGPGPAALDVGPGRLLAFGR